MEKPSTPTMITGAVLTKLGRSGAPHKSPFTISPDGHHLTWKSASFLKKFANTPTRVDLTAVKRVTRGQTTIPFVRYKDDGKVSKHNAEGNQFQAPGA